jgi:S1-C subfamily serine protease
MAGMRPYHRRANETTSRHPVTDTAWVDPSVGANPGPNALDLAALVIVFVAMALGARSGFFPQLGGLLGAVAGGGIALLAVPAVQPYIKDMEPAVRALVVLSGLIFAIGIGEALGSASGRAVHNRVRAGVLGGANQVAGAILGAAQGLLVVWLAGGILAAGPIPNLRPVAQTSWTVRQLNSYLPQPTDIAANLGRMLDASGLPEVFVGLEPFPATPVDTPSTQEATRIAAGAFASTVKVTADACGYELSGTGFAISRGYFVTNAHVVAGGKNEEVALDSGVHAKATVVLFDPALDVALLYAPNMPTPSLKFASQDPPTQARGAALGHPLGDPLTVIPAGVAGRYPAEGRDIYGDRKVTRMILELSARIDRGDSGGPLILMDGTVGGVIFAEAKADKEVGYALTPVEVSKRITPALTRTKAVSTGACAR